MAGELVSVALSLALQVGTPSPSETPNAAPLQNAYNQHGFEGQFEQRYPFDSQQNWVHGYFQDIPAYGGHVFFRPYNYKDVLSQSQTSAGWGMSPTMPYSQQFWHRYHDQATMLKLSRSNGAQLPTMQPGFGQPRATVMPAGFANPLPSVMPPASYVIPAPAPVFNSTPIDTAPPVSFAPPATPTTPAGPFLAPQ